MVQCEDCKFANWDATLFRDHEEGHWEGGHYIPPYSEQFDVYCIKHERFFMEQEITGDCQDGEYGPNNYHDVCKEHYRQIDEFKEELKRKRERRIKAEQAQAWQVGWRDKDRRQEGAYALYHAEQGDGVDEPRP